VALHEPAGQRAPVHCEPAAEPAGLDFPDGQGVHTACEVAPVAALYVSTGHRRHANAPGAAWKLPAAHAKQEEGEVAEAVGLKVPAGQGVGAVAFAREKKPGLEEAQDAIEEPDAAPLYEPAGHARGAEEPSGQKEPGGQGVVQATGSRVLLLHVPAAHFVQDAADTSPTLPP
jgi:hypothetical protein